MDKKQVFPVSGNRYMSAVHHLYESSFLTNIFPYVLKVYQMRIMGAEEIPITKQILEFLQVS